MKRLCTVVALMLAAIISAGGCTYPAPFSKRFTDAERAQLGATESCARSKGAKVWDAYLHSTDT